MAVGRYFKLYDPGVVRGPEYIQLPFQELAAVGAAKQRRYDQTKSELDKSLLDANIKSIEYHDKPRQDYIQEFNKAANELVQSGVDFGSQEGRSKVSNLLYQYKNNPDLQTYGRSVENFKKQQEHIADIKKKPGEYKEYNDPTAWDEKLYRSGRNPYIDQETGRPKEYTFRPVEAAADQNKPAYDLFDKIKDSGKITAYASPNEAQTYIASGKKGWEGVSLNTIKNAAQDNIPSYKQTAGGQDFLRQFHYENFEKLQNLPPEQIKQAEDNAVLNHLINIGSLYVRNKTTEDANLKATAVLSKKYDEEKAKEGLLGTFAQSGIKDNNIFTGELSVFNGVLKVDPATRTVNVDNEALHDKLKPQGLAKWSGILPDKYFKHNDTPYKALFAISRDLGLNKDETGKEIPGNEQVLKTLTYLQNLNTSAGSNYVPVEPVRDALGTKLLNSSDKEQMVGDPGETMNSFLKDNPQFIDEKTGKTRGKLAQLTLDGNKAKVLFKFTDKEGNEVNKEFTPGNKTYQEAFNRIAKIPTETKKLILDPKSRNQEDVSEAAAALGISSGKNRQYITSKLGNIQNLEPIGKINIDGETTVYMYKDKTNPDVVKAIRYNEDKKIFTPEESTSNVVNSYMSDLFNKDEFRDVTGKINKRMETQSFETPEE